MVVGVGQIKYSCECNCATTTKTPMVCPRDSTHASITAPRTRTESQMASGCGCLLETCTCSEQVRIGKRGWFDCFKPRPEDPEEPPPPGPPNDPSNDLTPQSFLPEKSAETRASVQSILDGSSDGGLVTIEARDYLSRIRQATREWAAGRDSEAYRQSLDSLTGERVLEDVQPDELLKLYNVMRLSPIRDARISGTRPFSLYSEIRRRVEVGDGSGTTLFQIDNTLPYSQVVGDVFKEIYPELANVNIVHLEYLSDLKDSFSDTESKFFIVRVMDHNVAIFDDAPSNSVYILDSLGYPQMAQHLSKSVKPGRKIFSSSVHRQNSGSGCAGFAVHDVMAMRRYGPAKMAEFAETFAKEGTLAVLPSEFMMTTQSMSTLQQMNNMLETVLTNPTVEGLSEWTSIPESVKPKDPIYGYYEMMKGLSDLLERQPSQEELDVYKNHVLDALRIRSYPSPSGEPMSPYALVNSNFVMSGQNVLVQSDLLGYMEYLYDNNYLKNG